MSSKLEFMKEKIDKQKAKISPKFEIEDGSDSGDSFEEGLE